MASDIERVLDTYSFEGILELNELTEEDVLIYLIETEFIPLPEVLPIDYATSN